MQAERLPLITKERMIFLMKRTVKVILLVFMVLSICAGCDSKKKEAPDDINGTVESPDSLVASNRSSRFIMLSMITGHSQPLSLCQLLPFTSQL